MPNELFSYRIARYRDRIGLTQADLGSALGVSQRYVALLESGQKEMDPNSSIAKLFVLMESNQVAPPVVSSRRSEHDNVREEAAPYHAGSRSDSVGTTQVGLSTHDAFAQVRADLAMMEGGNLADKRRAWHFLRDVHLPLLARCLKLE